MLARGGTYTYTGSLWWIGVMLISLGLMVFVLHWFLDDGNKQKRQAKRARRFRERAARRNGT